MTDSVTSATATQMAAPLFPFFQSAFNGHHQDPLHLTSVCKSAVSVSSERLNTECEALCTAWYENRVSDIDFKSKCLIDHRLYSFGNDTQVSNVSNKSRCFSIASPSSEEVLARFEVDFPGACQSSCQNTSECAWFTVGRTSSDEVFRCLQYSASSIAGDLVMAGSDMASEFCGAQGGSLADCNFGSPLCLIDPRSHLSFVDEFVAGEDSEAFEVISGPKFCSASSPDVATDMCTSLHLSLLAAKEAGFDDPLFEGAEWNGVYRLFGAGTMYSFDAWKDLMGPTLTFTESGHSDIDVVLAQMEAQIVESVVASRGD